MHPKSFRTKVLHGEGTKFTKKNSNLINQFQISYRSIDHGLFSWYAPSRHQWSVINEVNRSIDKWHVSVSLIQKFGIVPCHGLLLFRRF